MELVALIVYYFAIFLFYAVAFAVFYVPKYVILAIEWALQGMWEYLKATAIVIRFVIYEFVIAEIVFEIVPLIVGEQMYDSPLLQKSFHIIGELQWNSKLWYRMTEYMTNDFVDSWDRIPEWLVVIIAIFILGILIITVVLVSIALNIKWIIIAAILDVILLVINYFRYGHNDGQIPEITQPSVEKKNPLDNLQILQKLLSSMEVYDVVKIGPWDKAVCKNTYAATGMKNIESPFENNAAFSEITDYLAENGKETIDQKNSLKWMVSSDKASLYVQKLSEKQLEDSLSKE